MTGAARLAAPPLSPGPLGWGLATGLSVSVHVLLAATGVLAIAYSPPAAPPGSQTEIVVQSIPLVAGGGPQAAPRLGALAPEQRQAGSANAARLQAQSAGVEAPRAEPLAAVTPEPVTPPTEFVEPLQSVTPRRVQPGNAGADIVPRAPEQPAPAAVTRIAPQPVLPRVERVRPATPNRAQSAVRPLVPSTPRALAPAQPDMVAAQQNRSRSLDPTTPRAVAPAQTDPVAAQQSPSRSLDPTTPRTLAPAQADAATAPQNVARPVTPAGQRPRALTPAALSAAVTTDRAAPSGLAAQSTTAAPRAAREDSLLMALRARPERTLGDRQAAPRLPDPPGGGLQAPAAEDTQARDQGLYAQVLSYLRNLPDIDCFAALPALGADGLLRFEVFGPAATGLDAFRTGLEAETGLIPAMVLRPISDGQCATLNFVRATPDYPATGLYFELDSRVIDSGSQLSGRMAGRSADSGALHLLLVDNAGRVQVLDRFLGPDGRFAIPMTLQGGEVQTWQLLMAVSVPDRIDLLRSLDGPQAAGPLFTALDDLTLRTGLRPGVALVAFALLG
ncbi:hypothetical protein ROE7235_02093 [Roseibaca ekhonensis]|uniref:Uncharacterized protein n=1 Tax=Roseinatronobacter ekhonensis TaxID=254356 RepID=A0A3B0MMT0_9RHOB|nr:hypothetical protein [Roseibaca ekhonensis]SUZ32337.1 hypothetical protein ROE7235_02093 [Roseibaca ekhonensis]